MFLSHRITEHWNKATLENLIKNGIQESTYLEYKACAALLEEYEITDRYGNIRKKTKPTDSIKREISKDVSAFANAIHRFFMSLILPPKDFCNSSAVPDGKPYPSFLCYKHLICIKGFFKLFLPL